MLLFIPFFIMITYLTGDCREVLKTIPNGTVHCCVTSPPYWGLRDYGTAHQLGLEATPDEYVANLVSVFREVWDVLRDDGTLWLNLGDSYVTNPGNGRGGESVDGAVPHRTGMDKTKSGLKTKDLAGIPWRVAFGLQADGWYLRSDIIWEKPNCMPDSVKDRPTRSHEYIFLLTKNERYYYDIDAIREPHKSFGRTPGNKSRIYVDRDPQHHGGEKRRPEDAKSFHELGRNKRTVWSVPTRGFSGAHFATYPPELIRPCILAGCPVGGTVLDPFGGAGTTGLVAEEEGRNAILIELNPEYMEIAKQRTQQKSLLAA